MRVVAITLVLGLMSLSGCAKAPYTIQSHFNAEELAWSSRSGSGIVKGQAFMKTVSSDVKTCAGNMTQIIPVSAYTREMADASRIGVSGWANRDPSVSKFIRNTRCDARGDFSFTGLPEGDWIIQATVSWGVPVGTYGLVSSQGGLLYETLSLQNGETKEVILSR